MHDYFLYDWHADESWHKWHGFRHPNYALNNALRDFQISEIEQELLKKHNGIDTLSSFIEILGKHRAFHIVRKALVCPL